MKVCIELEEYKDLLAIPMRQKFKEETKMMFINFVEEKLKEEMRRYAIDGNIDFGYESYMPDRGISPIHGCGEMLELVGITSKELKNIIINCKKAVEEEQ